MSRKGECHFNPTWLNKEKFPEFSPWLRKVDDFHVGCAVCDPSLKRPINIKGMGKAAITSHLNTQMHKNCTAVKNTMNNFIIKRNVPDKSLVANVSHVPEIENKDQNSEQNTANQRENTSQIDQIRILDNFISNEDVTKAEIIYAFCQMKKKPSLRCFSDLSDCFPVMFFDSQIAKKFRMHKDKLSYVITYGLGPYLQKELAYIIRSCEYYAVSFDESLNKIAQKEQMDLVVRYWTGEKINTNYLTSVFLNGATAVDLLNAFKCTFENLSLSLKRIIQISMDGPNVNLRFAKDIDTYLSDTERDTNDFIMMEIGTCSLHIAHGSFKTAHKQSGWEIEKFLRAIYYFFKDSPTRRATYSRITGSFEFAKKFCLLRWVENCCVMERAKNMIPHLQKYVMYADKKPPDNKNYSTIKACLCDPFLNAKLCFLISICLELEKFLTKYQSNEPLLPFLYNDLYNIMKHFYSIIVKPDLMDDIKNAQDLMKIDLTDKSNLCSTNKVELGFSTKNAIKKIRNVKEAEILKFKLECQNIILSMCQKLKEKCPLSYKFVKGASCLSPYVMLNSKIAKIRVQLALEVFVERNHFGEVTAEKIENEYINFIKNDSVVKELKNFDSKKHQLDTYLMKICNEQKSSNNFIDFVKRTLILFHGNAAVERSFSFNNEFLVENLTEQSLISQRCVHDFIINSNNGNVKDIQITKEMIAAFKSSSANRTQALKEKRENESDEKRRKRKLEEEAAELKLKKKEIEKCITDNKKNLVDYEKKLKELEKQLKH